ncbi:MAG: HEPN domain-containing protein [Azonexus sp.]|nr:HEPN domain-containing protein [Azonexus sp.]
MFRRYRCGWTNGRTPRPIPIRACWKTSPARVSGCDGCTDLDGEGPHRLRIGPRPSGPRRYRRCLQPGVLRDVRCRLCRLAGNGAEVAVNVGKTHSGVLTAFSLHLVKNGPVPREIGRLLKQAEEIRIVADYSGDSISPDDARRLVEAAETFVTTLATLPGF